MTPEQKEFILKNLKKLSIRQVAKRLNLSRSEIEAYISETKNTPSVEQRPGGSGARTPCYVIGLLAAAFLFRLFYIYWLKQTPFFEPLSSKLDDGVYDQMAQAISGGNWMANLPFSAYRIPLYPYFLAILYKLFGHSALLVHLIQSAFGMFVPVMIFLISKKVFRNDRPALIGGLIACAYVPLVFFENLFLGESLSIFFNLMAIFFLLSSMESGKRLFPKIFLAGIFFGVSILLRPNTLFSVFFLAFFLAYLFAVKNQRIMKGVSVAAIFLVGVTATMAPITVRNLYLYRDFLPISAVGGVNLYIGNNPEADGKFHLTRGIGTALDEMVANSQQIAEKETGRSLKPSEASVFWARKAFHYVVSSPVDFLRLLLRKTAFFLNRYEFPDILDIYFVGQFIPFLRAGFWEYGIVLLLAACGIWLAFRSKSGPGAVLLGVFLAGYFISVIMFFVTARYRLPVVPVLIIFAGYGVDRVIAAIRFAETKMLVTTLVVAVTAGIFIFRPVEITSFGTNYNSLGIAMKNRGDFKKAEAYYRKAIEIEPNYPSPYYNLALLLDKIGRRDESTTLYERFETLKRTQS